MSDGYYTSGVFARKARVTVRTLRFYDKQGLLKPSKVNEKGYRLYTDEDFGRLQKILSLKYLGFSLEEIMTMTLDDDSTDMAHSLKLQRELIQKQIRHLQMMERTLADTSDMVERSGQVDWNSILNLIHLTNMEHAVADQYKTAVNLNVRIELHRRFSRNPQPWFSWLASLIPSKADGRCLEVGCGNGELWRHMEQGSMEGEIYITDISPGMVEEAKRILEEGKVTDRGISATLFFQVADCQEIPYGRSFFDVVIANHVLFYMKNLPKALEEVKRVLKPKGSFYCSAYGKNHMKEITALVQEFDPCITLSDVSLYEIFGLENGQELLERHFSTVEKLLYEDELLVDEERPLFDYIMSCHGNQSEILSRRQLEFRHFLEKKIRDQGGIRITKEAGVFVCKTKGGKL